MYKTILVPHAGTPAGDESLKHAIFIAKSSSAKIIELHIVDNILYYLDLIIMAKRRKLKGVKKLLSLGSVSRKIVENVKCPVLLIDIENL